MSKLETELREAVGRLDAAIAACPIQRRYQDICPRCKATSSEGCGIISVAQYEFIESARASLEAKTNTTPPQVISEKVSHGGKRLTRVVRPNPNG